MTTTTNHRTRIWWGEDGSTTMVQFRTDTERPIHIHTNMGWVNPVTGEGCPETIAETIARGYGLVEGSEEDARHWAGWDT